MCHSRISLEACVQDEAGRELLTVVAKLDTTLAGLVLRYLGLFRAPSRDLSNDRALKLLKEVLSLSQNRYKLDEAIEDTLNSLNQHQATGGFKQLTNHNYLKKVLKDKLGINEQPTASQSTQSTNEPIKKPHARLLVSDEEAAANIAMVKNAMHGIMK
jgi:hypothetical protein